MVNLPDIKLTDEEYKALTEESFYFEFGSESKIFRDDIYIIKIFNENFGHYLATRDEIESIRENKLQKIILLNKLKNFNNKFKPLGTYSYQGKFVGYNGIYLEEQTLDNIYKLLTTEQRIHYLRKIKEKLIELHQLGIIYGAVKSNNIFIDRKTDEITFCDIDNMQVQEYPIDLMNSYAKKFIKKYGTIDKKLDSYMMNLLTLEQFIPSITYYDKVLETIEEGFIPTEVDKNNNRNLVRQMVYPNQNYSGKYLIDNM